MALHSQILWFALQLCPNPWREKLSVHLGKPDIRFSLLQLRRFGFTPKQVLDIGAWQGEWTKVCLEVWPLTSVLCIEPQQDAYDNLVRLTQNAPNIMVKQFLLGAADSKAVDFAEVGTGSSVLSTVQATTTRPMRTIDSLINAGFCIPPELVKLDVQGYEMQVLEGFKQHFDHCQILQIEMSLLPLVHGSPLLHEMVAYLKNRGFVMFDIDELIRSPSDGAVWQIDALFCREDSPLRSIRSWQ